MLRTIGLASVSLLALLVQGKKTKVQKNFVTDLLERTATGANHQTNMMEFYGRLESGKGDKVDDSVAYLTMLITYDTLFKKMRFHFNMKEPTHDLYPEIDFQWNTELNLAVDNFITPADPKGLGKGHKVNKKEKAHDNLAVNSEKGVINISDMIVVYSFGEERLISHKTCDFSIQIKEDKKGDVKLTLSAKALKGKHCLHRDKIQLKALEREQQEGVVALNDLWFQNLEGVESLLSTAVFHEDGVEGYWFVNQDDLYASGSDYKPFFMLSEEDDEKENFSEVLFEIKDYDFVGPEDFHNDDVEFDEAGRPWLQIQITFHSKQEKFMMLRMVYSMDQKHLLINRDKSSFRAQAPSIARVLVEGEPVRDCKGITLQFQVVYDAEYIRYIMNDGTDECFPFTVEGKWHLNVSEKEHQEDLLENLIRKDVRTETAAERRETISDNDMLIESLESELQSLTNAQKKEIKSIGMENFKKLEKLRKKRNQRYDANWVEHDYAAQFEQKKDPQQGGQEEHLTRTKEEKMAQREVKKENWELKGALYMTLSLVVIGACSYYFCIRRKQLRQQQYMSVVHANPNFA